VFNWTFTDSTRRWKPNNIHRLVMSHLVYTDNIAIDSLKLMNKASSQLTGAAGDGLAQQ